MRYNYKKKLLSYFTKANSRRRLTVCQSPPLKLTKKMPMEVSLYYFHRHLKVCKALINIKTFQEKPKKFGGEGGKPEKLGPLGA